MSTLLPNQDEEGLTPTEVAVLKRFAEILANNPRIIYGFETMGARTKGKWMRWILRKIDKWILGPIKFLIACYFIMIGILAAFTSENYFNLLLNPMVEVPTAVRVYASESNLLNIDIDGATGPVPHYDQFTNPSRAEVVAYAFENESSHTAPADWILSVCHWESGEFRQFERPQDEAVLTNSNGDSTDWGLCQLNDVYHTDAFPKAQEDWQANVDAAWKHLDSCWERFETVTEQVQCYNGIGAQNGYADIVIGIHNTAFWSGKEPWGSPMARPWTVTTSGPHYPWEAWDVAPVSAKEPEVEAFPAYATISGMVVTVAPSWDAYGNPVVEIENECFKVSYMHLEEIFVEAGDQVVWGQTIGIVGDEGNVEGFTGVHVHYGIENLCNGGYESPGDWIYVPPRQ